MPKDPKRDRAKKEEAERRAKEEEEARIRAEKEEVERKEQEKREAAEQLLRENEECKIRKVQLSELDFIYEEHDAVLQEEQMENRKQAKWARYMKCDGSPDPTILPEINMYISLWREDVEKTGFEMVLKDSDLVLKLMEELEVILADTTNEELTTEKKEQYNNTLDELSNLLKEKLDLGCLSVMSQASFLANPETNNLEYVKGNDNIVLCLWGNLSKNPRIKSFNFLEKGIFFELPKILTLSDCVIRAMFTKFDHLSVHCSSFLPRIKQKVIDEIVVIGTEPDIPDFLDEEEEEEEEEEGERQEDDANVDTDDEDVATLIKQLSEDQTEAITEDEEEVEEAKPYIESDYEITTPEPVEHEDFEGDENTVDLRASHIIGGIIHFNLLQTPPQPKVIRGWTITQLVEPPELLHMSYAVEQPKVEVPPEQLEESDMKLDKEMTTSKSSLKSASKSKVKPEEAKQEVKPQDAAKSEMPKEKKDVERPPIFVTLQLPADVYFSEEPQIVRWDYDNEVWKTDGFLDKLYNEASRLLSFRIQQFGTIALIQDAHVNMPFQWWELRPRAVNHAQLSIIAAVIEVEIQIKDGLVCLSDPSTTRELSHLIDVWMSIDDLIKKMRAAGVNVFPAEDSYKYVNILDKNRAAEYRLYRQMALVSSAMAFSWSKWNADIEDRERIFLQAAEQTVDEPLIEAKGPFTFCTMSSDDVSEHPPQKLKQSSDDWWLCMVTKKSCTKLKMLEFDDTFNDERDTAEFYADLYHLTIPQVSETSIERISATRKNFVDTVYQLLCATRVITFA